MEHEDEGPDPHTRFHLDGVYDADSYDSDLEHFADFFDANGWPLFGDADPYSLTHPITGQSWHLAPRKPARVEADHDYEDWFELALEFQQIQNELFEQVRGVMPPRLRRPKDAHDPQVIYDPAHKKALTGTLDYLRLNLVPELDVLFSGRDRGLHFIRIWGEFCRRAGAFTLTADRAKQRKNQRRSQPGKEAHRRWFSHYSLREQERQMCNKEKAALAVERLVNAIVAGKILLPDIGWFEAMFGTDPPTSDGDRSLSRTFFDLTRPGMELLVAMGTAGLPPLDLEIPPLGPSEVPIEKLPYEGSSRCAPALKTNMSAIMAKQKSAREGEYEKLITVNDASEALGLPAFKLDRAARAGLIRTYSIFNGRRLVRLSEVIQTINASARGGAK